MRNEYDAIVMGGGPGVRVRDSPAQPAEVAWSRRTNTGACLNPPGAEFLKSIVTKRTYLKTQQMADHGVVVGS